MNYYENLRHGTEDFPIGIHDTICQKGFHLYPHLHSEFEFLVMTKGCGNVYIDDAAYELQAGEALFINCHQLHLGEPADNAPAEFFAVVFAPEIFGSPVKDLIADKYVAPIINKLLTLPVKYTHTQPWQSDILNILCDIHRLYLEASLGWELKIKARLLELWQLSFINADKQAQNNYNPTIENIKKAAIYIKQHYSQPLTLDDMASHINMNRSYFCRCFSEIMHTTPFEYLLQTRIDNSCLLLKSTSLSVGEIAGQCGFNSFSYFSKTFKRFIGVSPSEYARS